MDHPEIVEVMGFRHNDDGELVGLVRYADGTTGERVAASVEVSAEITRADGTVEHRTLSDVAIDGVKV